MEPIKINVNVQVGVTEELYSLLRNLLPGAMPVAAPEPAAQQQESKTDEAPQPAEVINAEPAPEPKKEEAEAESFAAKHEAVCNKEALKSAYILNKEAAQKMAAGFVKPAPAPQKVLNKGAAQTPALPRPTVGLREQMAALPPGERGAFYKAHASEF